MSRYANPMLRDLGVAIHVPGAMALLSVPLCLMTQESATVPGFALCALVSLLLGQGLFWTFRGDGVMRVRHAMDTAVLAWVAISLIGMLPFLAIAWWPPSDPAQAGALAVFRDPWNALFESASGFTTTGLTMTERPEALPISLQWWRSFTQWIGGIGVIVVMLALFHPSGDTERLFLAEAHDKTIVPGVVETVRTIWWIYLLFTLLAVIALRLSGLTWWQAVNYGLTSISTGGFGATDGNAGDFGPVPRLVLVGIVVVGATSFASHYKLIAKRQISVLWKDREAVLLVAILGLGAGLLGLETWWGLGEARWLDAPFQWVSAVCTAGFQTTVLDDWSPTARLLLALGMTIGGVAGSSAGGLKLYRVSILVIGASERIGRLARQPWRLVEREKLASEDEAIRRRRAFEAAGILALLWVLALAVGTLVLLHLVGPQTALDAVLLEVASALGNVGMTAGVTAPDLPWGAKLTLILLMWFGRLEIVPVLVLLASLRPTRRAA